MNAAVQFIRYWRKDLHRIWGSRLRCFAIDNLYHVYCGIICFVLIHFSCVYRSYEVIFSLVITKPMPSNVWSVETPAWLDGGNHKRRDMTLDNSPFCAIPRPISPFQRSNIVWGYCNVLTSICYPEAPIRAVFGYAITMFHWIYILTDKPQADPVNLVNKLLCRFIFTRWNNILCRCDGVRTVGFIFFKWYPAQGVDHDLHN
jgi:hypothetical protein